MNMNICFVCDDNFREYLLVAMASILKNAAIKDNFRFCIIDAGLSDKTKEDILQLKKIKKFDICYKKLTDDDFMDFPLCNNVTKKIYYYRLKIPYLFPNLERILYMDTDVIIMSSLAELYNIDMEGYSCAFGVNANIENKLQNSRLNLDPDHIYFNAGVMLIDCKKYIENNLYETCRKTAINRTDLYWHDQDLLNIVLEKNYKIFSPQFNFWPGLNQKDYKSNLKNFINWFKHTNISKKELQKAIKHPVIIHFAGGAKPSRETANFKTKVAYNKILNTISKLSNENFFDKLLKSKMIFNMNISKLLINLIPNKKLRHRFRDFINQEKSKEFNDNIAPKYGFQKVYINHTSEILADNLFIDEGSWIGGECKIYAGKAGIKIGKGCAIAFGTRMFTNNHNYKQPKEIPFDDICYSYPIDIGNFVWVGNSSIILSGVKIEDGAIIAAGSVVTKSVPKCAIVAGNPAKVIGYRDKDLFDRLMNEGAFAYKDTWKYPENYIVIEKDEFKPFLKDTAIK